MVKTTVYQITPFLSEGYQLPGKGTNNGTEWLREAVNLLYNRNKERLHKAGVHTTLFHNHDEKNGNTIARYPLIQYQKREQGYFVAGFNGGSDAIDALFEGINSVAGINNSMLAEIKMFFSGHQETVATNSKLIYTLTNWLPFNRVNYARYKQTGALSEKTALLEHILKSHIVNDFSRFLDLGFTHENTVVKIISVESFTRACVQLQLNKHTHDFQPFTVVFESNLLLPQYICLGNGKVYGFGLTKAVSTAAL